MNKIKIQSGEHTVINLDNIEMIDQLDPSKCYLLNYNSDYSYYYLTITENLVLPPKVYGDKSHLEKYLKKYNCQNRNLGVLLSGIKGDGKSVDAKILAISSRQPIIIINTGYRSQSFLEFISNPVLNNTTIFIDEFEKVYSQGEDGEESTVNILKLLDGYSNNKNLFIMTSNELNISRYLINRPSRIRYIKNYKGLDFELITEVVKDKLKNSSLVEETLATLEDYPLITMDVLIEIINDINDLDISCEEAIVDLNFNAEKTKLNLKAEISYKESKIKLNLGTFSLVQHLNLINESPRHDYIHHSDFDKDKNGDDDFYVGVPNDDKFMKILREEFSKKYPDGITHVFKDGGFEFEIKVYSDTVAHHEYARAF